jgi:hypothetical protein
VLSMAGDGPSSDDIIKILITSDNHVGYNEKDEIRGGDSFHTFEEVLKIAADEKVSAESRSARSAVAAFLPPAVVGMPRGGQPSSLRRSRNS